MNDFVELTVPECRALLLTGTVGRVAFNTPNGPRILPVSYTIDAETIIFRTTPYGELGIHGPNTEVAFEVDQLDFAAHQGWSVVATGRVDVIDDPDDVSDIQSTADPAPWAPGTRQLYFRLPWLELTGRRLGPG